VSGGRRYRRDTSLNSSATQLVRTLCLGRINSAELQRRVPISDMRPRDQNDARMRKLTHNELDAWLSFSQRAAYTMRARVSNRECYLARCGCALL